MRIVIRLLFSFVGFMIISLVVFAEEVVSDNAVSRMSLSSKSDKIGERFQEVAKLCRYIDGMESEVKGILSSRDVYKDISQERLLMIVRLHELEKIIASLNADLHNYGNGLEERILREMSANQKNADDTIQCSRWESLVFNKCISVNGKVCGAAYPFGVSCPECVIISSENVYQILYNGRKDESEKCCCCSTNDVAVFRLKLVGENRGSLAITKIDHLDWIELESCLLKENERILVFDRGLVVTRRDGLITP